MTPSPYTATPPLGRERFRVAAAAAAVLCLLASVAPSRAADPGATALRDKTSLSLGLLGGSTLFDGRLANYQWDLRPRMAWGAQALVSRGRAALGARAWRSQTVQVLDLPTGPLSPAVRSTTFELLGRLRVASLAGTRLWAGASAGRLRIDYRPDHVVVASGGPGGDVIADLAPVSEWTAGAGLGFQRPLVSRWTLGLALDRRFFALDTAHRSGTAVIDQRESFGDWSARLELAWQHPITVKGISR